MLIQVIAVEYLQYQQFDRHFKDIGTRRERIGRMVLFWLDRELESLTLKDVTKFIAYMTERKCCPNYINTYLFTLRSLLKYAEREELKVLDFHKIKPLPVEKKAIKYLSKDEIDSLFKFFEGTHLHDFRNRAMIAVMLDGGLRVSECCSLNRSQVKDILKGDCLINGKGGKERYVYFTWSKEFIIDYLEKRLDDNEALFISHCFDLRWKTNRLKPDGLRKYFKKASEKLGFQVNPHKLRKTALNVWKNNGMDIKSVSLLAGHDNISTTEKYYLGIDWVKLKELHKQFSYV